MTFWAKLLVIIVLVLSIAFAAISSVIFAKREDYRGQLDKAIKEHQRVKADLEDKIAKRDDTIKSQAATIEEKTTELAARQLQVDKLSTELDQLRGQVAELKSSFLKEQASVQELAAGNKALAEETRRLLTEKDSLKKANDDLFAKLSAEQKRSNDLQVENSQLKGKVDDLAGRLKTAEDTIELDKEIFAEAAKKNIDFRPILLGKLAVPDIKAKVLSVDTEANLVVLNKGRNQKVLKNYEFTVFRGDKFIAKVMVTNVEDDLSAARIVQRTAPIERGDNAWTQLQ